MNYKHSADSVAASIQGKTNASKKSNFHRLGPGGYKVAVPKWEKMKNNLIAKGIIPQTLSWPKRARYYFYAHGGTDVPFSSSAWAAGGDHRITPTHGHVRMCLDAKFKILKDL